MQNTKNTNYAIIVAGGKGMRMHSDLPKQFLALAGKPILMHSIDAFYSFDSSITIIVVLPENQIQFWKTLCIQFSFTTPHIIAIGGKERFYSVLSGLQLITTNGYVAIHDGVRPLISKTLINEGFNCAYEYESAIPVIDSIDSLRYVDAEKNYPVNRTNIKRVQTPQLFNVEKLQQAYKQTFDTLFTDDASVWEKAGYSITCFTGDEKNIKITTQFDLDCAELLINSVK